MPTKRKKKKKKNNCCKIIFFFGYKFSLNISIYLPMSAGAMRDSVDIFTAPSRDTNRSSQGTVAANATAIKDNQ